MRKNSAHFDVLRHGQGRFHQVLGVAGRDVDVGIHHQQRGPAFRGGTGERDANRRGIGLGLAGRVIVNLDHQVGALLDRDGEVRIARFGDGAGGPAAQESGGGDSGTAEAGIAALAGGLGQLARGSGFIDVDDAVMDHPPVTGTELRGPDVRILFEVQGKHEALELVGAIGGDVKAIAGLQNQVRLTGLPSFGKRGWRGLVLGIALGCAVFGPVAQKGDLLIGQAALMLELAVSGFGFPDRHVPALGDGGDQPGTLRRVLIGQQGEGRDFARAVTDGAFLVQDWGDVLIKGRRSAGQQRRRCEGEQEVEWGLSGRHPRHRQRLQHVLTITSAAFPVQ